MLIRTIVFICVCGFSSLSFAIDLGLSGSGKDIAIDIRFASPNNSTWGGYTRIVADFEEYQNGSIVSVCNDGSISGSTGSGTCSSHAGVNHTENTEFNRLAAAFGLSYWATNSIQLHGGVIVGMYTSNVDIGDTSKLDFNKTGVDVGVSYKILNDSELKLLISHETEQDRTYIGFIMPFFN